MPWHPNRPRPRRRPRPRKAGTSTQCAIAHSRGAALACVPPTSRISPRRRSRRKHVKTGGSRERLDVVIRPDSDWLCIRHRSAKPYRRSREPLALTRFGRPSAEAKFMRMTGHAPKRLPSRRWAIAHYMDVPALEDEDDDEYDCDAAWRRAS
jgi:hypothetical protein